MKSCIYKGQVNHCRYEPQVHSFSYTLFMMYVDLDELPTLFDSFKGWAYNKRALAYFSDKDHYQINTLSTKDSIRHLVKQKTGEKPEGPIRLLTHFRYFGHVFNPLSLYFCFDKHDEKPTHVVAEVTNTPWKEQHCYVLAGTCQDNIFLTPDHQKTFHVSPFMDLDMTYHWNIHIPNKHANIKIDNYRDGNKVFDASMYMQRQEITQKNLSNILIHHPFMTLKVAGAIHLQALKLWLKGIDYVPHPKNN